MLHSEVDEEERGCPGVTWRMRVRALLSEVVLFCEDSQGSMLHLEVVQSCPRGQGKEQYCLCPSGITPPPQEQMKGGGGPRHGAFGLGCWSKKPSMRTRALDGSTTLVKVWGCSKYCSVLLRFDRGAPIQWVLVHGKENTCSSVVGGIEPP